MYDNSRFYEITQALAYSSLATTANFSDSSSRFSRRRIPSLQDFPSNSSVQEVVMLHLYIESLDWGQSIHKMLAQMDLFGNMTSNATFIIPADEMNPYFHGGDPGRVTIAFEKESSVGDSYPAAEVIQADRYVVVSTNNKTGCNSTDHESPFEHLGDLYHWEAWTGNNQFSDTVEPSRYVIACVSYSAGIVTCQNCHLSTGGIVETTLKSQKTKADPLVEQALRMMPDVLALMSVSRSWQNWMHPWNLDSYKKGMLSVA